MIAFTGSTRAGRAVGALAAQHLKRVHLELGGNSALLVLDDVDLEAASSVGAWGSFAHQGQVCMTAGRHLVQSGVADAYVDALAARADRLPVGDPTTGTVALGPVIDRGQRDKIHAMVTEHGRRRAPGSPPAAPTRTSTTGPTVLADVPTGSPAYREEIFGPVAPVVRFDTVEEAVRAGERQRLRAVPGHPHPRRHARAGDRGADPDAAWCTSTTRRSTTRRPSRSAASWTPAPARARAARRPTSTRSPTPSGSPSAGSLPTYPM